MLLSSVRGADLRIEALVVDYLDRWKFDTMADCTEKILKSHLDSNVFLSKEDESVGVGRTVVQFDVIYALIVQSGEAAGLPDAQERGRGRTLEDLCQLQFGMGRRQGSLGVSAQWNKENCPSS